MQDNANIQKIKDEQDKVWWDGVLEGYHSTIHPGVWFTHTLSEMTPFNRGRIFGILLRQNEARYMR